MANKDEFKSFVQKNPKLMTFVKKGDMTWQKFYEMYDLYGEENSAWDEYLKTDLNAEVAQASSSAFSVSEVMKWLKGVNLDSLQSGVDSLQRVVGLLTDLGGKSEPSNQTEEYKPRPIYKHFED